MGTSTTNREGFEPREATVASVRDALLNKQCTCREVVSAFLARIETLNHKVKAVTALNPDSLKEADAVDARIAAGDVNVPLLGVPILFKDNFNVEGMATTVGSLCMRDCIAQEDAETVKFLRAAGAIILGKANLHEFALEGLTVSSLGGQSLNPYDLTRTPGGSSGGTGAAIAASFAVLGTGTDTMNSLRSPASACSLYSLRPTTGVVSKNGIVPVSRTQDAIGAIGRCIEDVAIATRVMAGTSARNIVAEPSISLKHLRIGIIRGFLPQENSKESAPVSNLMIEVLNKLTAVGVNTITINDETFNADDIVRNLDVQKFEYREELNAHLASPTLKGDFPRSMRDIFEHHADECFVVSSRQPFIREALVTNTDHPDYRQRLDGIAELKGRLRSLLENNSLDAICFPQQKTLVLPIGSPTQSGRNGILAALTGFPSLAIPIGFSSPTDTASIGIPVGMEILGLPNNDEKLFQIAQAMSIVLDGRRPPTGHDFDTNIQAREYTTVPVVSLPGLTDFDWASYPQSKLV